MTRNLLTLVFLFLIGSAMAQNNSLYFDGSDDHVALPNDPVFDLTNDFTLEAWINADEWRTNAWQGTIIGKDNDPTTGWVFRCGASGTLSFTVGTGSDWNEITSGPVMSEDTWHHVAAVLTGGESRIYIDGILVATGSCPASISSTPAVLIGESAGFSGRIFEGWIDEVRIWNIVRTQEEIADNRIVDLADDTPGLIAYYKFDETMGDVAENHMNPGVTDGTLINFNAGSWQDGYSTPDLDLKTEAIISPDPLTLNAGAAQVKARFLNNGIDPVSDFEVSYAFNGETPVIESVSVNLEPGETYVHTFQDVVITNGSSDEIVVSALLTGDSNTANNDLTINYPALSDALTVPIYSGVQHNFAAAGQTHVSYVSLPENNSAYGQLLLNISLDCPAFSGCDPWDQPAKLSLLKDGVTYEIARYITPYGKACGPWTVDVTSFKSILQGDCQFSSYVQVWGSSGWLVNIDLTYVATESDYPFQKVTPVYDTDNLVYGDPGISYDLDPVTIPVDEQTVEADYRLTVTGHGQGNTGNAAEFSQQTHTVRVNDADYDDHFLWKDDCAQNECSDQFGTWLFSRAGWCPGQAVDPLILDISDEVVPGGSVELDYQLQSYTNFLNTGYNGSSHTEPHYRLHAYLVEKGTTHYAEDGWNNGTAVAILNPLAETDLNEMTEVTVNMTNSGTLPISSITFKAYLFNELELNETVILEEDLLPGEDYTHSFTETLDMSGADVNYQLTVLVSSNNDEAVNDNVLSVSIGSVGIEELETYDMSLYPNPNNGEVVLVVPNLKEAATIIISDLSGREIEKISVSSGILSSGMRLPMPYASGSYLVQLISAEGNATKRMVIE